MNKFAKYISIFFIFLTCIFACAFRWGNIGEKCAQLYFSSQPIQKEFVNNVGRHFRAKERIYYLLDKKLFTNSLVMVMKD